MGPQGLPLSPDSRGCQRPQRSQPGPGAPPVCALAGCCGPGAQNAMDQSSGSGKPDEAEEKGRDRVHTSHCGNQRSRDRAEPLARKVLGRFRAGSISIRRLRINLLQPLPCVPLPLLTQTPQLLSCLPPLLPSLGPA